MTKSLKLVLTSILVASTAAAGNAVAAANTANSFDGFYAGAGISRDSAKFNYKVTSPLFPGSTDSFLIRNDAGSNGFSGAVFAGYGMSFGQFYLGAEIDAAANSVKSRDGFGVNSLTNRADYEMKRSYGISILPGVNVTDKVMIYGRLGYVNSKFEAKLTAPENLMDTVSTNSSKNIGGIRYGLGIATALMPNLNLRLDYTHADYSTHRITLDNPYFLNNSFKPSVDQVQLGISYRFA